MEIQFEEFFSRLPEEPVAELFEGKNPWEPLKLLKDFLFDILPELPRAIPVHEPLKEDLFLTVDSEVIPLKALEEAEDGYYFKGSPVKGAVLKAGAYLSGRRFFFGESAVVEPFSFLKEPVYVGKGG